MNYKKLSLILISGGAAIVVLSVVWFLAAYAEAMDSIGRFGGKDMAAKMMACLYSSPAICQGAGIFSDTPLYSPVGFWIGVIALLAGIAVRFATTSSAAPGKSVSAGTAENLVSGGILTFIPPDQYARYSYILTLSGAVGGLILMPLGIVALAGCVLALLGLTAYRPRLNALTIPHLGLICLIVAAAALLLFVTRGTFLFLLAALAQIACLYVGFNSYRHGRVITAQNLKEEVLMALKPGTSPPSDHEQP
ncbi:MAG: hypothetical protein H5U26_08620 [Immundisolibacter sp.]|jgi:hypothetical protein|uniref:hypothetical protein n=1 Tax=Immundisolibacter sp. TaxID=1934948 RepID=UPI0019BC1A83|nr:hypothetical protein [Immundisolibacter sp.]MBC7162154.1 hypothetical protein [Immundisolibacter sp.]